MNNLFDEFGRCIPGETSGKAQKTVRRYFKCDQPAIDLEQIYRNAASTLGKPKTSRAEFKATVEVLQQSIKNDDQLQNLNQCTYVPFILPQQKIEDIGEALESKYLPAVAASFSSRFPEYDFTNHYPASLTGKLKASPLSRHQSLLNKLQSEDVIGIYFPALDGYSLPAAREKANQLPSTFSLAGGVDTCAALIACPDLLMRLDGYPPLLWFGALESKDSNEGFHLESYGYNLTFNRRMHLNNADEYWANGLVISA